MYYGNNNYISIVDKTDSEYHRSKIIVHKPQMFYEAEFDTQDQLDFYADMLGFKYELTEERQSERLGTYREYSVSHKIDDPCGGGFWKRSDIPEGAKPFKALSNGSIVTCYFTNDGKTIKIYRPNPNAKEVYKPLPLQEHLAHRKIYGLY